MKKSDKRITKIILPYILWMIRLLMLCYMAIDFAGTKVTSVFEALVGIAIWLFLLFLPVVDLIYQIVCVMKYKRYRKQQEVRLICKEKNEDLMGFYQKPGIPWPTFYTLAGMFLFIATGKFLFVVILFLWLLIQIVVQKQTPIQYEQRKWKKLRDDVLQIWQEEKDIPSKTFHYAIIMEDDSGRIPSTFGRGNCDTPGALIFDHKTEVEPFLEREPEKNFAECWRDLYLYSGFFVYCFDSAKYTVEELEEKCRDAIGYMHFPVCKQIYIFLLGNSGRLRSITEKYTWMRDVSIQIVASWNQINLQRVIDDYRTQRAVSKYRGKDQNQSYESYAKGLGALGEQIYNASLLEYEEMLRTPAFCEAAFDSNAKYRYFNWMSLLVPYISVPFEQLECGDREYFFHYLNPLTQQIFSKLLAGELTFYFQARNTYVCGFFQNIFMWQEMQIAVLVEFEYAHLAMRFVYYYLFSKRSLTLSAATVKEDKELGDAIYELVQPGDMFYRPIHQKWKLEDTVLRNVFCIINELYGIEYEEEYLDFLHLVHLIRLLRNVSKGHGAIREGMQEQLWFAVYILLLLLNDMLCIASMEIELQEDVVRVGYIEDERWYWDTQYAAVQDGVPLLLHEITKKSNLKYINYYKGSVAVPEMVERSRNET